MKIHPVRQRDASACGPTCIQMVSRYFGVPVTMKKVIEVSKYRSSEGLSNKDIAGTLLTLGFDVEEKTTASWQDLQTLNTKDSAIIISWMMKGYIGHVSVLEKVTATHIFLADSVKGTILKIPKIIFLRLWFDYDDMWYPKKNTDIEMRRMIIVRKK